MNTEPGAGPGISTDSWLSIRTVVAGCIIGALLLVLAFKQLEWSAFVRTLFSADRMWITLGIGVYAGYIVIRSLRWSLLLENHTDKRPIMLLIRAVTWGTAANAMIPHSGEFLRAFMSKKQLGVSATSLLGSIAAERLFDFAAVIVLTIIAVLTFDDAPGLLIGAMATIALMGGVVLIGLILLGRRSPIVSTAVSFLLRLLPARFAGAIQWQLEEVSNGIRSAFGRNNISVVVFLSLLQWLLIAACIYLSMQAYDLQLSPWVAFVILPLTIAGLTLPTAPAYLGTIQVCFLGGLIPFGVSPELAVAVSFAYLSIVTFPVLIVSVGWFVFRSLFRQKID